MRGLDPRIHAAMSVSLQYGTGLEAAKPHGLPGHARQ